MEVNFIKLYLFIICLVLPTFRNSNNTDRTWLTYLVNHIHSCAVYQVLLIHDQDENDADYEIDNIIRTISSKISILEIALKEATNQKATELSLIPSFHNPRATTLIVVIDASSSKQLISKFSELISFLTELSEARSRPKCLFIILKKNKQSTYEELLRQLWSRRFLDTTFLEITRNEHGKSTAKMYNFNPFTDTMFGETYQQKSNLFPVKSRNLHRYPIKVDLFNQPPLAYVSRNLTGHMEKVFGPEVTITTMLSKAMNFTTLWIPSNDTFWGVFGCAKNESTGALHRLMHNEVQLFATQTARGISCIGRLIEWSTSIKMLSYVIVVPNIVNESTKVSSELRFHNVFIVISFLLLLWILTRIMHFHQHNWRLPHLVQIMLGLGAPLEPRRLVERIVLGSLLLSCILNSTFIYTAFTEVIHQEKSKKALRTIDDVLDSRFQPTVDPIIRFYMYNSTTGSLRRLLDKASIVNITNQECLDHLIQNKNIACIVQEHVANMMIQSARNENGQPLLVIVKEYLRTVVTAFPLESASPFLPQINDILLRFATSGILAKVQGNYPNASVTRPDTQNSDEEEKTDSIDVRRQVILLLVVGYSGSLLAFLCEILASIFLNRGLFERSH